MPKYPISVVPLFETIEDLQRSPDIYDHFLREPLTRRSLAYIQRTKKLSQPTGQVMIGYSDSNKDGGIMSSLVELRHALALLIFFAKRHRSMRSNRAVLARDRADDLDKKHSQIFVPSLGCSVGVNLVRSFSEKVDDSNSPLVFGWGKQKTLSNCGENNAIMKIP